MGALRTLKLTGILPKEVRDLLRGNPKWLWLLFGASGLVALVEAAILANLLFLGYALLDEEPSGPLSGLLGEGGFEAYSQRALLIILGSVFTVLVSLRFVLVLANRYLTYRWSTTVTRKLYKGIMRHVVASPIQVFDERQLGGIVHDLTNAPLGGINAIFDVTGLLAGFFLICSILIMLIIISPWVLLIAVVIVVLWFAVIAPPLRKRMLRERQLSYDVQSHLIKSATDTINGIREIRAATAEPRWIAEFSDIVDQYEALRGRIIFLRALPPAALQAMLQTGFGAAIILAAFILSSEDLVTQLPILGAFSYGLFRVNPVLSSISQAWVGLSQSVPPLRAAAEWTRLPEDPLAHGTQPVPAPIEVVRFDRLSFSYDSKEPTIVDADFCIQAGKVTAIVGASGAGKSTLIDLMLKFRAPTMGVLWIGDADLNEVKRQSWLKRIGLVRQDVYLFTATIRENLLQYKLDATEEELRSACRRAGALEFIDAMPGGLEAKVGERGVTLSGGQRQRIAIARALLRNPDILILDEATSALDGESEARVLRSLLAESPARIILLISHRLATVRNADHIVVLDQGRVVEQGTHEYLLARHSKYWELFSTQIGQDSAPLFDVNSD